MNDSGEQPDFYFATLEELVDEIKRRCDAVVVVTVKTARASDELEDFKVEYRGGMATALGLLECARVQIHRTCHKE